jgi:hypothetical protein
VVNGGGGGQPGVVQCPGGLEHPGVVQGPGGFE